MGEAEALLAERINGIGGKMKIVPANILKHVQKEWVRCLDRLENTDMYHKMLKNCFDFSLDPDIRSLVIIALPSPPCCIEVEWNGKVIEADIPPVYVHRDQQLSVIKKTVNDVFAPYQLTSWPVALPKKMLAAMCGFGKYGRNNILYIEGMGSCHRLTVFGTDMVCSDEIELAADLRMDRCSKCGICIKQCKTGAISSNGVQIDPDKCLTFLNETKGAMPEWIPRDWHNSLVGCIRCQERCPANKGAWNRQKVGKLSADETQAIMKTSAFDALDAALQNKLSALSLDRYFDVLERNISLLFGNIQNQL